MWMAWGPELTFFCNDAYAPTLGIKRDWVLGRRRPRSGRRFGRTSGRALSACSKTGKATWDEGLLLFLERSGFPKRPTTPSRTSPLADDDG